ncbi:MAG: ASKHA domain-containing protein, partial [Chloroflexota bacterium]|nr:ASKHA domain-containing protein [Chloroflexota bacterium]
GEVPLGLAVDVGTTKLAAYLVDMTTGRTLAAQGAMNPQIAYGEDVMARLTYARQHETGADELQAAVVEAIGELLQELCQEGERHCDQVVEAVLVGNTAMHHLLLGLPTRQLGEAPYVPAVREALDVKAHDLDMSLAPGAYVHLLPNIAGFVGADHVAMLLATGIDESAERVLGLDIGTNTEVALRANGRFLACSTASGPAFEGAHIQHGMRAAAGAIEHLRIAPSGVEYQAIEDLPPVGLCGSGILDAVAQMRLAGVLNDRGGFLNEHPRVREGERGLEFLLVPAAESGTGQDIVLTRGDVGEIQLAKGAIQAGINVLLDEAQLQAEELDAVIVAGAFGTYIDIDSAIAIGLLPDLPRERFRQVGNAAGMGAKRALLSRAERRRAQQLAREVEYIELTTDPRFSIQFAEAMLIP